MNYKLFLRERTLTGVRRATGHGVMVHCQMGVSRSSTIVISYLMKSQGMDLQDAYTLVKTKRSVVKPKKNFLRELIQYGKELKEEKEKSKKSDSKDSESSAKGDSKEGDKSRKRGQEASAGKTQKRARIGPAGPPPSNGKSEEGKENPKPVRRAKIGPMRPPS